MWYEKITSNIETLIKPRSLISQARVLVVDDDPAIVKFMEIALKKLGCEQYKVLTATAEALAYALDYPVDIVVMDFHFQNESSDGSVAVREIQKFRHVPIVYISGATDDCILEKIKSTEDSSFLQKPFSVEEFKFSLELALYNHLNYALQKAEKRYKRITETITDYIYTVKIKDGQVVETVHGEACVAVTGYTKKEFAENNYLWLSIVPEQEREIVTNYAKNLIASCSPVALEHRIIRKDGKVRWVSNTPVFYYSPYGDLEGYDGIITDITDRKMAEEALIAHQAALEYIIEERTAALLKTQAELEDKNKIIEHHLVEARKTQELLLPPHNLNAEIVTVDYIYRPMEMIGGDFLAYTHFKDNEKKFGVFIGDITGHGISASLYPSSIKAFTDNINRRNLFSPAGYLETLNQEYYSFINGSLNAHFLTALYGYFYQDENSQTVFSFSSAGHPAPLVYRKDNNIVEEYQLNGGLIGYTKDLQYKEKNIFLFPGDRLFLYTDGITETINEQRIPLDTPGFMEILREVNQLSLDLTRTLETIMQKTADYRGNAPLHDDIILFMAEVF